MAPISSNFNQQPIQQSTSNINQQGGTQQASDNFGPGSDLANIANTLSPQQLQQIVNTNQGFDQFGGAGMNNLANMPLAAQTPFNIISPSSAYANSMSAMSPTYYSGQTQNMPFGQMIGQAQSQFPMSQQYIQQAFGQPGMQQMFQQYYGNPNNMNAQAGPGGPMGGTAGLNMQQQAGSNISGSENLAAQQNRAQQEADLKQNMDNYSEALQLSSAIESAMHNVRMSIIQSIR